MRPDPWSTIEGVRKLVKQCGAYAVAQGLAKRGVSLDNAYFILLGYPRKRN